jgi:hypothetical protein
VTATVWVKPLVSEWLSVSDLALGSPMVSATAWASDSDLSPFRRQRKSLSRSRYQNSKAIRLKVTIR